MRFGWADLDGWVNRTSVHLSGWEAETVKHLGEIYSRGCEEFNDKNSEAPYRSEELRAETNMNNIKSILRRPVV